MSPAARSATSWVVVAAAAVIAAYAFFATAGTGSFRFRHGPDEYRSLATAYLNGQLHLREQPDPRLAALADPYDSAQRGAIPIRWDNSYYDGRYYLYFSPVPALIAYIPWRVATGRFPDPALVLTLFAVAAWLFQVATVFIAAPEHLRGSMRRGALVLALGLANLVPYTLLRPDVYELAVMSGYAFASAFVCSAAWMWFRRPTPAVALMAGLACGLSLASRISLAPLLVVLAALAVVAWRRGPRARRWPLLACLVVPVAFMVGAVAGHNAARFGSPLEFGTRFMLNSTAPGQPLCSPLRPLGWERALNAVGQYAASVPALSGVFPFVRLRPGVSLPADKLAVGLAYEDVAGLALLFPFVALGLAALPWAARAREDRALAAFAGLVALCGAAVAFTVASCQSVILRYELDFWPAVAVAAAIGVCRLASAATRGWQRAALAVVLAWSLAAGALLGMSGNGDLFRARNPQLFERLVGALSPTSLLDFPRRVGCYRQPFRDLGGRDHGAALPPDAGAPPEACARRCREAGARYAAALGPGQCACSAVLGHRGQSRVLAAESGIAGRSVDFCQRRCDHDPSKVCGIDGYGAVFMLRP